MLYVIMAIIIALFIYLLAPRPFQMNFYKGSRNGIIIECSNGFLTRESIQTADNGYQRIFVPNPFDIGKNSFDGKLMDAISLVQRGFIDEIIVKGDPREYCKVKAYRYLDRNYGERMQRRTLRTWKNRKFAWVAFAMGDPLLFDRGWAVDWNGEAAIQSNQREKHFLTETGANIWVEKKNLPFMRVGQVVR